MWLSLLALAVTVTLELPSVGPILDRWLGMVNASQLLKYLAATAVAAGTREIWALIRAREDDASIGDPAAVALWWWRGAAVACAATMTMAFAAAPIHHAEITDLTTDYATDPWVLTLFTAFLAYLAAALLQLTRLSWTGANEVTFTSIRFGLRLIATGTGVGLCYCLDKVVYLIAVNAGVRNSFVENGDTVRHGLLGTTILLVAIGLAVTRMVIIEKARSLDLLYPLWVNLLEAVPESALDPVPSRRQDRRTVRHVEERLTDRVVEIRDAIGDLSRWADSSLRSRAAQAVAGPAQPAHDAEALVTAAWLAAARLRKLHGLPPVGGSPPTRGGDDRESELRFFEKLARAYSTSGVRAFAEQDVAQPVSFGWLP